MAVNQAATAGPTVALTAAAASTTIRTNTHGYDTASRGEIMAYSLRCADTGNDCPGEFRTDTEDELMQHVQLHAQVAHPGMSLDDATVAQIKDLVKSG